MGRKSRIYCILLLIFSLLFIMSSFSLAQDKIPEGNKTCLTCHENEGFHAEHNGEEISLMVKQSNLSDSVHGSFTCNTCHMNKDGYPHEEVDFGKDLAVKVSENCQKCHTDVRDHYRDSKHWKATKNGEANVTCVDCHGSHDIQKVELTKQEEVKMCADCHTGEVLEGYQNNFHGRAVELGSEKAASCVDCHDAHKALGPEEEASLVSEENRPETCAECHEDAKANFAKGNEHLDLSSDGDDKIAYFVQKIYFWLIIGVIGFMFFQVIVNLIGKYRRANDHGHDVDFEDDIDEDIH